MKKPGILVVEDEELTALALQLSLEDMGYEVLQKISSGEAAIDVVKAQRPDLVLMDIYLDGQINGIEAARKIRGIYDIPIVYMTANSDSKTMQEAKLTQPFG